MNILGNFKSLLFSYFWYQRTIDVLDTENKPVSGKIRTWSWSPPLLAKCLFLLQIHPVAGVQGEPQLWGDLAGRRQTRVREQRVLQVKQTRAGRIFDRIPDIHVFLYWIFDFNDFFFRIFPTIFFLGKKKRYPAGYPVLKIQTIRPETVSDI